MSASFATQGKIIYDFFFNMTLIVTLPYDFSCEQKQQQLN